MASAQTVVVRHIAPGSTVELILNATPSGSAKADAAGNATIAAAGGLGAAIDANVWLDTCGAAYRVVVAGRGAQPPAEPGCSRVQIEGIFQVERVTSLVIDTAGTPSLRIRQGRPPDAWLRDPAPVNERAAVELPPLTGLTLFGGAGFASPQEFSGQVCGTVSSCPTESALPLNAGVAWWFTNRIAAEARYGSINDKAESTSDTFRFDSKREGAFLSVTGRVGFQAGRFRPFGRGGLAYHRATMTTTETVNDATVTIDETPQIIPGGTQILQFRTGGWAPVYGGGVEFWFSPIVGIYGDVQRLHLKGDDLRGTEARIDDKVMTAQFGVQFRLP